MIPAPANENFATELLDLTESLAREPEASADTFVGRRFGRFRLLRELGRGGMGRVFLAEQSGPVTRRVAIKLLTSRRLDAEARHLFDVERAVLARMQHPAIARLIEADTTADGMPFFAMDYVDGPPLDRYLRDQAPTLDERVSMLVEVANTVAHAHRQGLAHCDLKPSNVLVQSIDGRWQPRLIDFGIARSVDMADNGEEAGTPAYMSPEQATPGASVDIRADVHALGALLLEAATGQRLRDPLDLSGQPSTLVRQRIREGWRAPWPSLPPKALHVSRFRWRELGCIVDKALAHDPEARYPGADAFAADLVRWQQSRALIAMPSGLGYHLYCWVRRHRAIAALSLGLLLAVIVGSVTTLNALHEARQQRDEVIRREQALAETVRYQRALLEGIDLRRFASQLVGGLVEKQARLDAETGDNAALALGQQLQKLAPVDVARTLLGSQWLDPAASLLDGGDADPGVLADMRLLLARINRRFSRLDEAATEVEAARKAYRNSGNAEGELAADLESARIVQSRGNAVDALTQLESVLATIRERLPEMSPLRMEAEEAYGTALVNQGRYADALVAFQLVISLGIESGRNDSQFRGLVSLEERTQLYAAGQCDGDLLSRMQRRSDDWAGLDDPSAQAGAHYNLGSCHYWRGEYRAALSEFEQSVALYRQFGGDYHPLLPSLRSMRNLSALGAGKLEGLEPALSQAAADAKRSSGSDSVAALVARQALAELWSRQGSHEQALAAYRHLLQDAADLKQANPALVIVWQIFNGQALRRAGKLSEARAALANAAAACEKLQGENHMDCLSARVDELDLHQREAPVPVASAAALCARIDAVAMPDALLRSRCSALWLATLEADGAGPERIEALRVERLGWLDAAQLDQYAEEDAAVLRAWVRIDDSTQ